MKNAKKIFIFPILYSLIYILIFRFTAGPHILGTTLLSLIGIVSSILLSTFTYRKISIYKRFWLCMLFASFSYLIGDISLIFMNLLNPPLSNLLYISYLFYLFSSMFILAAIYSLILKPKNKWNNLQLLIDSFVLFIFVSHITYHVFFYMAPLSPFWTRIDYWNVFFYVVLDFLMLAGVLRYLLPCRHFLTLPKSSLIYAFGFICLFIGHFSLYYQGVHPIHSSISYMNLWVSMGLLWISCAGFYTILAKERIFENKTPLSNQHPYSIDKGQPLLIFFCYLILTVVSYKETLLLFSFTFLLCTRYFLLKYIKMYAKNKYLLQQYKDLNKLLKIKIEEINKLNLSLESKVIERTQELQLKNKKLYDLANTDTLTNLPNRRNFIKRLNKLILEKQDDSKFALLFIDLDRFKSINDLYGHKIGDKLLLEVANRLNSNLRDTDFIARQSGDEFIIILNPISDEREVSEICTKLNLDFQKPFDIEDYKIVSTISIGCAIYPLCSTDYSELMRFADIALYRSKSDGKNKFTMYNLDLQKEINRKMQIESQLFRALKEEEFELYYQPQLELSTNRIVGLEALIRWKNKDLGFISPSEFIPIAEENGLIIPLGYYVLKEACLKAKYINEISDYEIKIGINISPKQFLTTNLVNNIVDIITQNDINPNYIDLEITEECGIKNEEKTINKLRSLKNLGITISIDDFGTGYSSLSYLKRYPIDTLKIAMELIKGLGSQVEDLKIVQAIIAMSHSLNVSVIAEGVETEEQMNLLRSLGCHKIQGYHIGKPMPLAEVLPMITRKTLS